MELEGDYLGFVESIDQDLESTPLEGPGDEPLPPNWEIHTNPARLRMSGIFRKHFLEIQDQIDPLQPFDVTDDQRAQRLAQLRELVRAERLPLIDIHLGPWILRDEILAMARVGGWYRFSVTPRLEGLQHPVFLANPESEDGGVRRAFLTSFNEATEDSERLVDIFSLVHVADWGPDGDPGDEPVTGPLPPDDGQTLVITVVPQSKGRMKVKEIRWTAPDQAVQVVSVRS